MEPLQYFLFRRGDGRVFAARVLSVSNGTVFAQYCDSQQTVSLPAEECVPLTEAIEAIEAKRARAAKKKAA